MSKIPKPDLPVFIARTKRVYNIELYIARENDKLLQHLKKWEKLIQIFQLLIVTTFNGRYLNSDRFCVANYFQTLAFLLLKYTSAGLVLFLSRIQLLFHILMKN